MQTQSQIQCPGQVLRRKKVVSVIYENWKCYWLGRTVMGLVLEPFRKINCNVARIENLRYERFPSVSALIR